MLIETPDLQAGEQAVLDLVRKQWKQLHWLLNDKPVRWTGLLRQGAMARGIRGSNSIEGYEVSDDDAVAAVEGDAPYDTSADAPSWLAVTGYRDAMTYALKQADDPETRIDVTLIRGLHYLMMKYANDKHPGSWRPGPIFVHDDRIGEKVHEGADRAIVPALMDEFARRINAPADSNEDSPLIIAAMAHLNLAMIHPFSDGNGRMARCVQTLLLARAGLFDPVFASIEEWLVARRNTDDYYDVLSEVGTGRWDPSIDARPWIRFVLKAHYQQAQTLERRQQEFGSVWEEIDEELDLIGLDDRASAPLVEAAFGRSIKNARYRTHADVSNVVASRDLKALVQAGLLEKHGKGSGSFYRASESLRAIRDKLRLNKVVSDPFDLVAR